MGNCCQKYITIDEEDDKISRFTYSLLQFSKIEISFSGLDSADDKIYNYTITYDLYYQTKKKNPYFEETVRSILGYTTVIPAHKSLTRDERLLLLSNGFKDTINETPLLKHFKDLQLITLELVSYHCRSI
jgi:hypothetical protein